MTARVAGLRHEWQRVGPRPTPQVHAYETLRAELAGTTIGAMAGTCVLEQRTPLCSQANQDCTANAWTSALELVMPAPVVQLSRRLFYWTELHLDGSDGQDAGSFIRTGATVATTVGICPESVWPYDHAFDERPTLAAYEAAYDHRGVRVHPITSGGTTRCDDVEACIRAGKPVVFGVSVGRPFADYFDGTASVDEVFDYPAHSIGGHAMVIVGVGYLPVGGVTRRCFLALTSWGEGGSPTYPGRAWMTENWLESADELYAVDYVPAVAEMAA